MATFDCIAATGHSLERLLTGAFKNPGPLGGPPPTVKATLISNETAQVLHVSSPCLVLVC